MVMRFQFLDMFGSEKHYEKLYVIKSEGRSVYVGLAERQCVSERLIRHIGSYYSSKRPSRLSTLLYLNHPQYFGWNVDVYSLADACDLTGEVYDCLPCAERGLYRFIQKEQGEELSGNAVPPSRRCLKSISCQK